MPLSCHTPAAPIAPSVLPQAAASHSARIALVGMPNTGKSTFFNRITGANARTGNWPGVTVELLSAKMILGDRVAEIIDLPGIYSVAGYSEDELVVQQFLQNQAVSCIAVIINSLQIERQLPLVLHLKSLGLPLCVLVNMQDEAKSLGMQIDTTKLSQLLGCPVQLMSAKKGTGVVEAIAILEQAAKSPPQTMRVDGDIHALPEGLLADSHKIFSQCVSIPTTLPQALTDKIDGWLLHPKIGLWLFALILLAMFQGVYSLSGPIQDVLGAAFDWIKTVWLNPFLLQPSLQLPPVLISFITNGLWDGIATVASFLPVVVVFFVVMSILDDTGYLSRVAYLLDSLMAKLGLDGRSFVMVLMGFGCNVPALMGTRIMRSRSARLLSMLIIPFSLCSARLQVFVFLIGILFARHYAGLVLFSLYVMGVLAAILTAVLFKQKYVSNEPFLLELPPYRLPTMRMLWRRSLVEIRQFIKRTSTFITIGVIVVWALTYLPWGVEVASSQSYAGIVGEWMQPLFAPLGIDAKLSISLLFGFIAKEIVVGALAVIYAANDSDLNQVIAMSYTWIQAYSFMLFVLIYTPCLATLATLRSEAKSSRFMWISLLWSLGLAWVVSLVFYQVAIRVVS